MPSKPRTEIKIIEALERMRNSVNGNPRFRVYFTDGTLALTMSDASVNYGLANPEYRGVPVVFTFTRAGRISHATPVNKNQVLTRPTPQRIRAEFRNMNTDPLPTMPGEGN